MWTVLTLVAMGAALLILETILPGMIAGVLGLCCLIAGIALGYTSFGPDAGTLILLGVGGSLLVGSLFWVKYFPGSRLAKVFISRRIVGDLATEKPELLEQTGIAQTNLRPSGTAIIDGQRVDVEGMRVVVRAV
jgi:membrane-bound serine protease (ClpP class)